MHSKAIRQVFEDKRKLQRFFDLLLLTVIFCPNQKKGPITRSQGKGDLFVPPESGNRGTKNDLETFTIAREFLLKNKLVGWRLESKETPSLCLGGTEECSHIAENLPFKVKWRLLRAD